VKLPRLKILRLISLGLLTGSVAFAQGGPVRLMVQRGERVNPKTAKTVGGTKMRVDPVQPGSLNPPPAPPISTSGIFYFVKVSNTGQQALTGVKTKWTILWVDGAGQEALLEGEHTCDIPILKNCEFETDVVAIRPTSGKGSSRIAVDQTADVVGYVIETSIADKVVNTVSDPVGIKGRIDQLRKKAPAPNRGEVSRPHSG
jgi:hypothetical protein